MLFITESQIAVYWEQRVSRNKPNQIKIDADNDKITEGGREHHEGRKKKRKRTDYGAFEAEANVKKSDENFHEEKCSRGDIRCKNGDYCRQ